MLNVVMQSFEKYRIIDRERSGRLNSAARVSFDEESTIERGGNRGKITNNDRRAIDDENRKGRDLVASVTMFRIPNSLIPTKS
jgi:hypothetical protein